MARDRQEDKSKKEIRDSNKERPTGNQDQENNNTPEKNVKWDQAQRRQQASPRGYNENLDSENPENQNTQSNEEQVDQPGRKEDPNDPKKIGDQISQRQQTIDEGDAPQNKKKNTE